MKRISTLFIFLLINAIQSASAGTPIDVADNTLKISGSGEEVFYYGFAAGDQVIFNFEEVNGKELKEIEIIEMPGSSKFMAYKSKKVENKTINIQRTAIYKFRFVNGALLSGRICRFKIQRLASRAETENFNTNVLFRKVYDTSYINKEEKYLINSDTAITTIQETESKVHSELSGKGSITNIKFTLPEGTIAWSYYIGVNQEGREAYEAAQKALDQNGAIVKTFVARISPLGALALGLPSFLNKISGPEAVRYQLVNTYQPNIFSTAIQSRILKSGNSVNDFAFMEPVPGELNFVLANANAITAISAVIRIEAVVVKQEWGKRVIPEMKIRQREEMYLAGIN